MHILCFNDKCTCPLCFMYKQPLAAVSYFFIFSLPHAFGYIASRVIRCSYVDAHLLCMYIFCPWTDSQYIFNTIHRYVEVNFE